MLPFTTYKIPEVSTDETPSAMKWLCIVTGTSPSAQDEGLLMKIIGALNADFEKEVCHIRRDEKEFFSAHFFHVIQPKLIISFGIAPEELGLWIDLKASGIRVLEKFTFIRTMSLTELNHSPLGKKQLWSALQDYMEMVK